MRITTGDALLLAYAKAGMRAIRNLKRDKAMTASQVSAGFIIKRGKKRGKRTGFQVFVRVCRYSEELLKRKPDSGGLICGME